MAARFKTKTPNKLLSALKKAIDDGHITTWTYDEDGDFTHTSDALLKKAWFRPKVIEGKELIFYILTPTDSPMTTRIYASYHSRLSNAMLGRFDETFDEVCISALPENDDVVG